MLLFIKKYIQAIIIVILSLVLIGSIHKCSRNEESLNDYKTYNESFKTLNDKKSGQISVQEAQILTDKDLIKSLKDTVSFLKDIDTQIKTSVITKIEKVEVPIKDYVYIHDSLGISYLKTPATFHKFDKWYSFDGTITSNGNLLIDSLSFTNKLSIYIGTKRGSLGQRILFKRQKKYIVVKDENPYSYVESMSNFTLASEKRKNFSLGIGPGVSLGKGGIQPSINAGIYFNLINF